MKTKIYLFLFIFFLMNLSYAQSKVTYTDKIEVGDVSFGCHGDISIEGVLGTSSKRVFVKTFKKIPAFESVADRKKSNYGIAILDRDMSLVKSLLFETIFEADESFQNAIYSNGKVIVFSGINKGGETLFQGRIFDEDLDELEKKVFHTISNDDMAPMRRFDYSVSGDSSKILFSVPLKFSGKEKGVFSLRTPRTKIALVVIDAQLNLLWKKDVVEHASDKKYFSKKNVAITNNAEVYLFGRMFRFDPPKNQDPVMDFHLFIYGDGKLLNDIEFDTKGTNVKQSKFIFYGSNKISLVGFYGNGKYSTGKAATTLARGRSTGIHGVFRSDLDLEKRTISNSVFTDFSKDFILKNKSEIDEELLRKKDEPEMFYWKIKRAVISEDNELFIAGHQLKTGSNIFYFSYRFALKMNSNGKLAWAKKINTIYKPKTGLRGKYGMITLFENNTLYFIYNENLNEFISGKPKKITNKDNLVVVHSVDDDGGVRKEVLKDVKGVLVLPFAMKLDNKSVLITHGTYKGTEVHGAKCNILKVVK